MPSLNKVLLMGNLTRTPELRYTPSGAAVCEFGIATNRKYTQNNEQKEEVCYIDVVVWGKQGEACQKHIDKGSSVHIEGRLQFEQWDDRESGKKRSKLKVVSERVQFLGGNQQNNNQQQSQSQGYQAPQQGGGYPAMPNDAFKTSNDAEDDIPF